MKQLKISEQFCFVTLHNLTTEKSKMVFEEFTTKERIIYSCKLASKSVNVTRTIASPINIYCLQVHFTLGLKEIMMAGYKVD